MRLRLRRPLTAAAGSCALAAAAGLGASDVAPAVTPAAAAPVVLISPDAVHVRTAMAVPPTTAYCEQHYKIACYEAAQVQRAYNLPPLLRRRIDGKGQTIVIVDSFGSPTVAHDLAVFDTTFGLPAPPSLKVIQPAGKVAPYEPTSCWSRRPRRRRKAPPASRRS